jgi:uncharacterized membrane protein
MAKVRGASSARHSGNVIGLIFLVFLVLKLTGVIDWSWWWVTSPLWLAALAVVGLLMVVGGLGYLIYRVIKRVSGRRGAPC